MSLHDESFPDDPFLDILDFSPLPPKRFQFPHKYRQHNEPQHQRHMQPLASVQCNMSRRNDGSHQLATNTASSLSVNNLSESESSNEGRPSSSNVSDKTVASDPTGLADDPSTKSKSSDGLMERSNLTAASYQDIHSEYTKRRYKHVESKVGKYIAQMMAEDEKRRKMAKFRKPRSMPDTLSTNSLGDGGCGGVMRGLASSDCAASLMLSFSDAELHKRHDSHNESFSDISDTTDSGDPGDSGDADRAAAIVADSSSDRTTPSASASTSRDNSSSKGSGSGSGSSGSAAPVIGGDDDDHQRRHHRDSHQNCINKLLYNELLGEKDRIQSYADFVQSKLDEKIGENMRLKRNVDYMRIELSNCQDKLRAGGGGGLGVLFRHPVNIGVNNAFLNGSALSVVNAKSAQTQTELTTVSTGTSMSPMIVVHESSQQQQRQQQIDPINYVTPQMTQVDDNNNKNVDTNSTNESNGNIPQPSTIALMAGGVGVCIGGTTNTPAKCHRSVATIQPISLNFSNLAETSHPEGNSDGHDRASNTSGNSRHTGSQTHSRTSFPSSGDSAIDIEPAETHSPTMCRLSVPVNAAATSSALLTHQLQRDAASGSSSLRASDEFIYFHTPSDYIQAMNTPIDGASRKSANRGNRKDHCNTDSTPRKLNNNRKINSNSLRRRWWRLFGSCARCDEPNQTMNGSSMLQDLSCTQIPLLDKSPQSHCRNMR